MTITLHTNRITEPYYEVISHTHYQGHRTMNPKIRDRWSKALKSGEYTQGKYRLRTDDNKFCCLGVLTDLYLKEHQRTWDEFNLHYLPLPVMKWADLDASNPRIGDECAGTLNDNGVAFNEIAEKIEAYL